MSNYISTLVAKHGDKFIAFYFPTLIAALVIGSVSFFFFNRGKSWTWIDLLIMNVVSAVGLALLLGLKLVLLGREDPIWLVIFFGALMGAAAAYEFRTKS